MRGRLYWDREGTRWASGSGIGVEVKVDVEVEVKRERTRGLERELDGFREEPDSTWGSSGCSC